MCQKKAAAVAREREKKISFDIDLHTASHGSDVREEEEKFRFFVPFTFPFARHLSNGRTNPFFIFFDESCFGFNFFGKIPFSSLAVRNVTNWMFMVC